MSGVVNVERDEGESKSSGLDDFILSRDLRGRAPPSNNFSLLVRGDTSKIKSSRPLLRFQTERDCSRVPDGLDGKTPGENLFVHGSSPEMSRGPPVCGGHSDTQRGKEYILDDSNTGRDNHGTLVFYLQRDVL